MIMTPTDIQSAPQMARLPPEQYTLLLEEDMQCARCNAGFETMPALKAHLEFEFEKMLRIERERVVRRKAVEELLARAREKKRLVVEARVANQEEHDGDDDEERESLSEDAEMSSLSEHTTDHWHDTVDDDSGCIQPYRTYNVNVNA